MAAIPYSVAETGRRISSDSHKGPLSHGRGGAGNIGRSSTDYEPVTLETPTLKSEIYTTGRGGSGNMARNTDPEAARRAQDVVGIPRRESTSSSHVGRGGAANIFRPSTAEIEESQRWESAIEEDSLKRVNSGTAGGGKVHKGLADLGKEYLFGKK